MLWLKKIIKTVLISQKRKGVFQPIDKNNITTYNISENKKKTFFSIFEKKKQFPKL
jgi:hypothetical protein